MRQTFMTQQCNRNLPIMEDKTMIWTARMEAPVPSRFAYWIRPTVNTAYIPVGAQTCKL